MYISTYVCTKNYLESFRFIPPLVFRVHGDESENEEVQRGGDYRQTKQDEDESKGHVLRFSLEGAVLLQRDHITKADRRQGDETVVHGVEVGPSFVTTECSCAPCYREAAESCHHADQVNLGCLNVFAPQKALHVPDHY